MLHYSERASWFEGFKRPSPLICGGCQAAFSVRVEKIGDRWRLLKVERVQGQKEIRQSLIPDCDYPTEQAAERAARAIMDASNLETGKAAGLQSTDKEDSDDETENATDQGQDRKLQLRGQRQEGQAKRRQKGKRVR